MKLTKRQIVLLIHSREVYGMATKSSAMAKLVALGLYADTGDKVPFFRQTDKGKTVSSYLYGLQELDLL